MKGVPGVLPTQRLDKWLWAARLFKTRALAAEAVQGGRVHVGGGRVKAGRRIRVGEVLDVSRGNWRITLEVVGLNERRRPAGEAQALYRETDESRVRNEQQAQARRASQHTGQLSVHRPNKHQRRELRRLLGKD